MRPVHATMGEELPSASGLLSYSGLEWQRREPHQATMCEERLSYEESGSLSMPAASHRLGGRTAGVRSFRYLDALTTAFVVVLLVSNLLAQKICRLGPFNVSGALLLFPVTYIFGDVFTEVYGFAASRRAIWLGFFGTALLYAMGALTIALPAAPGWKNQAAFAAVFAIIPRILVASLTAFWCGEFVNSYVMARMKLLTGGRHLWTRTVGSTVAGQAVDTVLVITLTFGGSVPTRTLLGMIVSGYLLKVAYEVLATPVTYWVVHVLKRVEHSDPFDRDETFNPFLLAAASDSAPGQEATR